MTIVEELKGKLENASSEEISALEQSENPIYWFLLLAEYPEFAPDSDWWFALYNRCDLPWSQLLAAQPQFEKYCHWESVSRLELFLLAYRAPEIFQRRFPQGREYDLYAFLTPLEKSCLLSRLPEYDEFIDWDEINAEFSIGNWFSLLADQPQFAIHCDLERLYPNQRRKLLKHQPGIFGE